MDKIALITGITGQDGSYLADYLLHQGYTVHGIMRRSSSFNTSRIDHLFPLLEASSKRFHLHYGDLTDYGSLITIIRDVDPDEIYHLGAQSHVKVSFDMPIFTGSVTGIGTAAILEAIRKLESDCRFYQASSSEMFGASPPPQSESTQFYPRSPYAAAKVYSYWITVNYRESYGMHASNGILFNHESPRRGGTFVTKKIVSAAARIKKGLQKHLILGNLNAKRDWGYAPEYIIGMTKIIGHQNSGDYVMGTGHSISVRNFLELVFKYLDLEIHDHVKIDKKYFRPAEVDDLQADTSKSRKVLNWEPKIKSEDLIKIMVDYEINKLKKLNLNEDNPILINNNLNWVREY
jgi:GDPmannose 4,6-dehydratase